MINKDINIWIRVNTQYLIVLMMIMKNINIWIRVNMSIIVGGTRIISIGGVKKT